MIINNGLLLRLAPILEMVPHKASHPESNTSYGLTEAGYDIRIKQEIIFDHGGVYRNNPDGGHYSSSGNFVLASSIEEFNMPDSLVGVVHDKSTWARRGLSVFNTVIEPGWKGYLTLELVFHGGNQLRIPAGSGIAQILFTKLHTPSSYEGKYNHQPNKPVEAK